ncbi:MAG TPA: flagellar hook-length control protein FliK [Gallionellaceae bacterium]|nr:flagellar hook-length control protein FliK [Gallionellaceae bacterium]
MTNLPINISNAPAKAAASKQPSNNGDVAQQDGQDFGNVLTRQVADSAKPAEPTQSSSGDAGKEPAKQLSGKDEAEASTAADASSTLPADMLAALLAQQNLITTPQPNVSLQPVANAQTDASAAATSDMKAIEPTAADMTAIEPAAAAMKAIEPAAADMKPAARAAAGMKADIPAALAGGNVKASDPAVPALDTKSPTAKSAVKDSKGFVESLKASFDTKAAASGSGNHPLRESAISELASTAQQTLISAPAPTAAAAASPISISTPVTQPAWGDEFGQKITWMATQRNQSAELHLNPPQLGPLDVVLKVNGDQATAMFTSPHAAVRDAIEQALPKLREMLADNGIMLGNAMVSDQPARNDQDSSSRKSQGRTAISGNASEPVSIQGGRPTTINRHNGMVDTFA